MTVISPFFMKFSLKWHLGKHLMKWYMIYIYIYIYIYLFIYLLTAIVLSPGGRSTVHIYTQTIHRTIQNKQYIEQHNKSSISARWKISKPAAVLSFQLCHQLTNLHLTSKTKHILPGLDRILNSSICFWDADASIQVDKCVCEHGY